MREHNVRYAFLIVLLFAMFAAPASAWSQMGRTACVTCHSDADYFDAETIRGTIESYADDVHASIGLSCHDCHGGNPDPQLAEDMESSMDPNHSTNPYRGIPDPHGFGFIRIPGTGAHEVRHLQ